MKDKTVIRKELTELLETYYNGSFSQMSCDYIRSMGMTSGEVEQVLEMIEKEKGCIVAFLRK